MAHLPSGICVPTRDTTDWGRFANDINQSSSGGSLTPLRTYLVPTDDGKRAHLEKPLNCIATQYQDGFISIKSFINNRDIPNAHLIVAIQRPRHNLGSERQTRHVSQAGVGDNQRVARRIAASFTDAVYPEQPPRPA